MVDDPHDIEQVRGVLRRHQEELMSRPHVVGVGIGRPAPGGPYVLTVMTDRPVDPDPTTAEGVRLVWQHTGPFQLHGA